ncbi:hypothetical protein ElyMa_004652200 [Elysia marginata]|uniref:Uncharacterized protein n=1 Tax=Elysia marginata TaxID=1093978 RepID=A0AAV4I2T4_9GAST|nr:hypothetical protein ElyMa_004652200 [Elysia marginata]
MYPSHQRSIHTTRAVSNARHSERVYPSHKSSIQRKTLGEDVSISPEHYPTLDTRRVCIHLTRAVSNAGNIVKLCVSRRARHRRVAAPNVIIVELCVRGDTDLHEGHKHVAAELPLVFCALHCNCIEQNGAD